MLPMTLNGGISAKLRLRKPIAVVRGRQENRPGVDLRGLDDRLFAVHALPQSRRRSFYDVHRVRNGHRHQDEQRRTAFTKQLHAGPARESQVRTA